MRSRVSSGCRGRDVFFLTGTDEHGLKMAQAAREKGVAPAVFAEEMSSTFKAMDDALNISYDRFIRTTEPAHHQASQAIWQAMAEKGDIYLGRYEGWYSVRDEAYYGEEELVVADSGEKLSPQGTEVEWTVEESWFFRLSAYQDRLLAHYEADPDFIRPDSRRNEVLRFVEGGLADLSISRTSFDWGVKVPGSPNHVMYVWLDALTNYLTGVGYPDDTELYRQVLASRSARYRQGRRALPRGLLAGFPDVGRNARCRSRCSATASCSRAARRCPSRSAMSSIRSIWSAPSESTSCAISCCARSRSARTAATAPRRS